MPQNIMTDELRSKIANMLRIQNLPKNEQDDLIVRMGNALMERASLSLMAKLPEDVLAQIKEEEVVNNPQVIIELINKYVENSDEVVNTAIKEGIEEYHKYLNEEEAKESTK